MTSPSSPSIDTGKLKNALKKAMELKKNLENENQKLKQELEEKNMKIDMLTPLIDEATKEKDALFEKLSEINEKSIALEEELAKTKKILIQKESELKKLKYILSNNQNIDSNHPENDLLNFDEKQINQKQNDDILLFSNNTNDTSNQTSKEKATSNFDLLNFYESPSKNTNPAENNLEILGYIFNQNPEASASQAQPSVFDSSSNVQKLNENQDIFDLNSVQNTPITSADISKSNDEAIKKLND